VGESNFNINVSEPLLYNIVTLKNREKNYKSNKDFLKSKFKNNDNKFYQLINNEPVEYGFPKRLKDMYKDFSNSNVYLKYGQISDNKLDKIKKEYITARKILFAHEFLHALKLDKVYTLNKQDNVYYYSNNIGFNDFKTKSQVKKIIENDNSSYVDENALQFDETINDLHAIKFSNLEKESRREVNYYMDENNYYTQNKLETHSGYSDCLDLAEMVEILYGEETLFLSSLLYRQQLLEDIGHKYEKFFKNNKILSEKFEKLEGKDIDDLNLFEIIGTSFKLINNVNGNKYTAMPIKLAMKKSLLKAIYEKMNKENINDYKELHFKLKNLLLKKYAGNTLKKDTPNYTIFNKIEDKIDKENKSSVIKNI
ncbi:MAG: hypothetical protein ACOCP8_09920, partial [archaeon]